MARYDVTDGETSTGLTLNNDSMYVSAGGTANSTTIKDGGYLYVYPGGTANKVAIDFGYLSVYRGGTATEIEWTPCVGSVWVENGAHVTFASEHAGVYYGSDGQLIESTTEPMNDRKLNDERQSMYVMSDGIANRTVVYFSGCQHVCSGGTVNSTWVRAEGNLLVSSGGTASDTTLDAYSNMAVFSGGAANNTIVNSGTFNLSGGVADGVTLNANGGLLIEDGGKADNVAIKPQGTLVVSSGSANVTEWTPGKGNVMLYGDAQVTFASEYSGVYYGDGENLISSAAEMNDAYLDANYYELYVMNGGTVNRAGVDGGCMAVFSGGAADVVNVAAGGKLFVNNGGKAEHATIGEWGEVYVNSGGTANKTVVNNYGSFTVFGSADDVTVKSSGTVWVLDGGKATNAMVNDCGDMVVSGATADITTVNFGGRLFIDETGKADHTTVFVAGTMYVSGSAENTTISGGDVEVRSGGTMTKTKVTTGDTDDYWGSATVSSGGTAINTTVDFHGGFSIHDGGSADIATVAAGGRIYIGEGATVTNITAVDGARLGLAVAPGTYAQGTYAGSAFETKDGAISGYTVHSYGGLDVVNGGVATDITVTERAQVWVADGVLDGITMNGGYMYIANGGKVTGKMRFNGGDADQIEVYDGATVDFDLTRIAPGDEVLVNDISAITGYGTFTLTVDGTEKVGDIYGLADGASDFNKTISVVNTSGETLGSLWVGSDALVFGEIAYKLTLDDSILTLTVDNPTPPNGPAEPLNNYLYDKKKTPAVNADVTEAYGTHLTEAGQEVCLDLIGSIDHDGYHNRVEKAVKGETRDTADYAKIVLEHGAKLSFHAEATAAATFTVYNLVYNEKKDTYSLKKLQTLKLADKDKDGVFTADSKKPVDLPAAGEYYVSMQYADKRKDVSEAYYNVRLNGTDRGTTFFLDADDGWNNWLYDKKKTPADNSANLKSEDIDSVGDSIQLDKKCYVDGDNFVGFGDDTDFVKFSLHTAANLSLNLTGVGAAANVKNSGALKVVIYSFDAAKKKMTSLQTTTVKSADLIAGTADTKLKLLEAGDYYVSVKSTNAAKGDQVYYTMSVGSNTVFFANGDGWNDYVYDKKKTPPVNTDVTDAPGFTVRADNIGETVNLDYDTYSFKGKNYTGFVGHNDATDFVKINVAKAGTASFKVVATDAAKIEIWSFDGDKLKMKSLQSTALKKTEVVDGVQMYGIETKAYAFKEPGEYYLAITSTNAKTGGNAFYNVTLLDTDIVESASLESALAMTDSLSFGQYDANAIADASCWQIVAKLA